jgi:methionyl aminopeptidase
MSHVTIKSKREIELMRDAGKLLRDVHNRLGEEIAPGISTWDLNKLGEELIRKTDSIPSFLNYEGYPASVCVSLNDEVVHGIPRKDIFLEEGDIVSLDIGLIHNGYQSDAARTHPCGKVSEEAAALIKVTEESFFEGMKFATAGNHLHDISNAIGNYCIDRGYGVVRDLVGHGIGREMHEDPPIPNYPQKRKGILLVAGMTLAVEPMINIGRAEVIFYDDGWTCATEDGSLSAHYENTILITDGEPEILTL